MKKNNKIALILMIVSVMIFSMVRNPYILMAEITGECSNCHTMHNSQSGSPMATYGATGQPWTGNGPYALLTRGDCLGCHGMGTGNRLEIINGSEIPQVYHTDVNDLAGGNFAYITGAKGSGASDAKGHNVVDVGDIDNTLYGPPGGSLQYLHDNGGIVNSTNLTCAGDNGCHGNRYYGLGSGLNALKGAHHRNVDGALDSADNIYDSYRFLNGVKGLENPVDRWQNVSAASHNEYYGETTPMILGCSGGELHCHGAGGIRPPNNTISGFCSTCHGNFHTLTGPSMGDDEGIGPTISSPFQRHPSDIALPATGEYASYTSYSVEAPVARNSVPSSPNGAVVPGSDVVMCLSCHGVHATDYPDLLRWDYTGMVAGSGSNTSGCFVCHSTKDE